MRLISTAWCAAAVLHGSLTIRGIAQAPAAGRAAGGQKPDVLFSESFDDPQLLSRGWYDGSTFTISGTEGLLPHAQTLWIDALAVGARRPGPVKAK